MKTYPFLCSAFQTIGYCKNARTKQTAAVQPILAAMPKAILYWVPLTARRNNGNLPFHKKVQRAHDLFHQGEFEGASYLYRDLYEGRNDSSEILIGLIASLYFLQEYNEAAALATKLETRFDSFPDAFIHHCIERSTAKEKSLANESTDVTNASICQDNCSNSSMVDTLQP